MKSCCFDVFFYGYLAKGLSKPVLINVGQVSPHSLPSYFSPSRLVWKKIALSEMATLLLAKLPSRAPAARSPGMQLRLHVGPWGIGFAVSTGRLIEKSGANVEHLCPRPGSLWRLDFSLLHPEKLVVSLTPTVTTDLGSGMKIRQIPTGSRKEEKVQMEFNISKSMPSWKTKLIINDLKFQNNYFFKERERVCACA